MSRGNFRRGDGSIDMSALKSRPMGEKLAFSRQQIEEAAAIQKQQVPFYGRPTSAGGPSIYGPSFSLLNNLQSYFKLEEASGTRVDQTGFANLTATNSPGNAAGKMGLCLSVVAASSQYLSSAIAANLVGRDFTITGWCNPTSAANFGSVFGTGGGQLRIRRNGVTANMQVFLGVTATDSITPISNGNWFFLAVTRLFSTEALTIQVNNDAGSTVTVVTDIAVNNGPTLGQDSTRANFWDGLIDEVGIWTSSPGGGGALTPAQLTALYNNGAGVAYPFVGVP